VSVSIEAARRRLSIKLSKTVQGHLAYPWFVKVDQEGNELVVYVLDRDKARATLTQSYYGYPVRIFCRPETAPKVSKGAASKSKQEEE
jgi:hypothetical protein